MQDHWVKTKRLDCENTDDRDEAMYSTARYGGRDPSCKAVATRNVLETREEIRMGMILVQQRNFQRESIMDYGWS